MYTICELHAIVSTYIANSIEPIVIGLSLNVTTVSIASL